MPKKAGNSSTRGEAEMPSGSAEPRRGFLGVIGRLIGFVFWLLGFVGRIAAIAVLGYCCFAPATSGTISESDSAEPTELVQAGWPWVYTTSEVSNLADVRGADPEEPVRPIYDVISSSEPALAADVGVFGAVVILLLFASKLFDRFNSWLVLIAFFACFVAVGYVAYLRSIQQAGDRNALTEKILASPGSNASTEFRYTSAMDVVVDRIQSVVYRTDLSKVPSRRQIHICKVQDLDNKTTEEVCSLPLLKELTLVNCKVSETAITHLLSAFRLRKIVFDGCDVSSVSIDPLRALKRLKDIQIKDSVTIEVAQP